MDNNVDEFNIGDMSRHRVYPTNFAEVNTGSFGIDQQVGSVLPDPRNGLYWDPSQGGEIPGFVGIGEVKMFHVDIEGFRGMTGLHFDAYTLNQDGTVNEFAPLNCDAEVVGMAPEPGTIALFGLGLLGFGGLSLRRRFA